MEKIKIMLVEDQTVVREGIKYLLGTDERFEVASEAGSISEAVRQLKKDSVDIILMDIQLPDGSGLFAAKDILDKYDVKVIILSVHQDYDVIQEAMINGCSGFLPKNTSFNEIKEAIETVMEGEHYIHPIATTQLIKGMQNSQKNQYQGVKLNEEEIQVLQRIADGLSYIEIAESIYVSERTVRRRMQSIFDKLGVNSKAHAVAEAMRRNLLN